ncbi:MAG: single-stranded DNA-binding protein [Phycisphaeraceae bacterium]|nr:single-stranded DNA-binding protein [Phycisphaeraceae bacterium]
MPSQEEQLLKHAKRLRTAVNKLGFAEPVTHVYNPLDYTWPMHEAFIKRYGGGSKRVLMLGMNPGPWGMAQTGLPFGEIEAVREYIGIKAKVGKPKDEHPKRPVDGLACERSEVSGRRLWGLMAERYPDPADFFAQHIVVNYCPLVFMGETGKNITPDKLPVAEREPLEKACDAHLRGLVEAWKPEWIVGVGAFAEKCAKRALDGLDLNFGRILHPSPASPIANRGWAPQAERQMIELGLWD